MKLYIPTTSLNFNNILSTESISPKGFYASRGFGYSRWFSIPENNLDGAILLYEYPAVFTRPKSDLEDHPLLIEIETDEDFPVAKKVLDILSIRFTWILGIQDLFSKREG